MMMIRSNKVGYIVVFLGVFGALVLQSVQKTLQINNSKKSILLRKNLASTIDKKTSDDDEYTTTEMVYIDTNCKVPELNAPKEKIHSSFLASYPGSGARLQWQLVEAITGIVTTDDKFSNGHHNVVGIKTHFPCAAGREFPGAEDVFKAIVFIRHPIHTLPAYHNIIYASENSNKDNDEQHSGAVVAAPIHEWLDWRDLNFERELEAWRKHFTYWMDRYSSLNRLVVPYEQIITRRDGPALTSRMAQFLKTGNQAVNTTSDGDLPCIWKKIVEDNNKGELTSSSSRSKSCCRYRRLSSSLKRPPLETAIPSKQQKVYSLNGSSSSSMLSKRWKRFLQKSLWEEDTMPRSSIDTSSTYEQNRMSSFLWQRETQPSPVTDQRETRPSYDNKRESSSLERTTTTASFSNNEIKNKNIETPKNKESENGILNSLTSSFFSTYSKDDNNNDPSRDTPKPMLSSKEELKLLVDDDSKLIPPTTYGGNKESPINVKIELENNDDKRDDNEKKSMVSSFSGGTSNKNSNNLSKQQPSSKLIDEKEERISSYDFTSEAKSVVALSDERSTFLSDKNNLTNKPDAAAATRPYTESQRKGIVNVLTALLEKYSDDVVLAPVLVNYIDEITAQSDEGVSLTTE